MNRRASGTVSQEGAKRTHVARLDRNVWVTHHNVDPPVTVTYGTLRTYCGTSLGRYRRVVLHPAGTLVTCPNCPGDL